MERKEIIFTDIYEEIIEKEHITDEIYTNGKWHRIPYKTELTDGNMLLAYENDFPENITLKLGLTGRWKVYVATAHFAYNDNNYLHLKLSSHPCWTELKYNSSVAPRHWRPEEYVQEILMFNADLTGEDLIISRPQNRVKTTACVLWVRCVPLADEADSLFDFSNTQNKTMQYHFDGDITSDNNFKTAIENCMKEFAAAESDAQIVSQEISFWQTTNVDYDSEDFGVLEYNRIWEKNDKDLYKIKDEVTHERIQMAKKSGYKLYATNRMQMSSFCFPYLRKMYDIDFADNHSEYSAVWRDGTVLSLLSYAYRPVREYVISYLIDYLKKGYDGLTLIFHRGIHIGFEEPVVKLFSEKYPEADIKVLPLNDKRSRECRSKFMTDFMAELKQKVDELAYEQNREIGINVISDYSLETALDFGLDIKEWAKSGLITEVSQADMEIFEDLTDCMSDTDNSVIDIDKYRKANKYRPVVCRNYASNMPKALAGMTGYLELEEKYGVKVYNILPWVHSLKPFEFVDAAKQLYNSGAKRLFMWNTLQCMQDPIEWSVVKRLGHRNDLDRLKNDTFGLYNHYRVLSYGNVDISLISPNWRG